jgi:hypothetical protein
MNKLPEKRDEAHYIERRGRVVNTRSYLGGPGFDYRPQRPAVLIEVFRSSLQSLQANARIVP